MTSLLSIKFYIFLCCVGARTQIEVGCTNTKMGRGVFVQTMVETQFRCTFAMARLGLGRGWSEEGEWGAGVRGAQRKTWGSGEVCALRVRLWAGDSCDRDIPSNGLRAWLGCGGVQPQALAAFQAPHIPSAST